MILVTGGTGLVGPRLLPRLTNWEFATRALVRAAKEVPDGVDRFAGDLYDSASLEHAAEGVTAVVHLAAVFRTRDEHLIWRANLEGTRTLIAAVKKVAPQARFVMSSTSNVYVDNVSRPAREEDPKTSATAYGASKLAAEAELGDSGLTWGVLRFPFIYGEQDGHIEATAPALASVHRHPAQRYSVLHHQDLASAVRLALTGAIDGRAVNIADDHPVSILEMAQIAGADYETSAEPLTNPWQGQVDISLAKVWDSDLRYSPCGMRTEKAS